MFCVFVGAHPVGEWHALAVRVKSPTGVGSYKHPHLLTLIRAWDFFVIIKHTPWRPSSFHHKIRTNQM